MGEWDGEDGGDGGMRVGGGLRRADIKGEGVDGMSGAVLAAREKLRSDVYKGYSTYHDLVETVKEEVRGWWRGATGTGIKDGEILDGLNILWHYLKDHRFLKGEDTYQCCAALRRWTKYLACDDSAKKAEASKDDRFKRIYLNNYKFRRQWVALLRGVVEYVELMYENEGERKTQVIHAEIARMTNKSPAWWAGFDWPTVKGHIETAEAKLALENAPTMYERYAPWDIHRGVLLEGGRAGAGGDVAELLAELQIVGES